MPRPPLWCRRQPASFPVGAASAAVRTALLWQAFLPVIAVGANLAFALFILVGQAHFPASGADIRACRWGRHSCLPCASEWGAFQPPGTNTPDASADVHTPDSSLQLR